MTSTKSTHDLGAARLILGYDGGESSRRAAGWAARELIPDGTLVIVHACRPLHAPAAPLLSADQREELGRAVVDELMLDGETTIFDINIVTEVSDEDPVTALLDAARRHGASAIVVGCERHSRLHRALGTVTSELQKTSRVPVIVVPAVAVPSAHASGIR